MEWILLLAVGAVVIGLQWLWGLGLLAIGVLGFLYWALPEGW